MGRLGEIVAAPGRMALLYTERLIAGVTAENFGRFARPGGTVVKSNHPAFVFGHLALYPQRVLTLLGLPVGETAVPANYESLFKDGVECRDDAERNIYPGKDELIQRFTDGYKAATAAIAAAPDEKLLAINPTEGRSRELFPTLGAALSFYVAGHPQMHLGQVSAWRRMMGLSPA